MKLNDLLKKINLCRDGKADFSSVMDDISVNSVDKKVININDVKRTVVFNGLLTEVAKSY